MQAYLKLDHIDKTFTAATPQTEVLKDINLTIERGEYVSIIGHSGCGKSTFLKHRPVSTNTTMGCVLLEIAKSIRQDRIAPWCSRITACCPGSRSMKSAARRRQGVRVDQEPRRAQRMTMHNLNLDGRWRMRRTRRPANIRRHE